MFKTRVIYAILLMLVLSIPDLSQAEPTWLSNLRSNVFRTGAALTCATALTVGLSSLNPSPENAVSGTKAGFGLPPSVAAKVEVTDRKLPSVNEDNSLTNYALQGGVVFVGQALQDIQNLPGEILEKFDLGVTAAKISLGELLLLSDIVKEGIDDLTTDPSEVTVTVHESSQGVGLLEITAQAREAAREVNVNLPNVNSPESLANKAVSEVMEAVAAPLKVGRSIYFLYALDSADPAKQVAADRTYQALSRYFLFSLGLGVMLRVSQRSQLVRRTGVPYGFLNAKIYWDLPKTSVRRARYRTTRGIKLFGSYLKNLVKPTEKKSVQNEPEQ